MYIWQHVDILVRFLILWKHPIWYQNCKVS